MSLMAVDYDIFPNSLRQHLPPDRTAAILETNITEFQTNSFFARFDNALLYSPTQGSAEAQKIEVRAEVLGGGIPALSHAQKRGQSFLSCGQAVRPELCIYLVFTFCRKQASQIRSALQAAMC